MNVLTNPFPLIQRILFGGYLAGVLISWKLWISSRLFPLIPVIEGIPGFPSPLDFIIAGLFVGLLAAGLIYPHRRIVQATLVLTLILAFQDQMRWQPWVYTYALLLAPFALKEFTSTKKEKPVSPLLLYFQIFLIGLYFWSGVHKLNDNFVDVIYPLFAVSLFKAGEGSFLLEWKWLGYIIPVTEFLVGIGLIFPRTRRWAAIGAIATHVIIILYLSPLGHNENYVVIPWNMAMIGVVFLSCYRQLNPIRLWQSALVGSWKWTGIVLAFFVWLMPAFNLRGRWDTYLSFNLYSGNIEHMYVGLRNQALEKIDKRLTAYYTPQNIIEEGKVLDISEWSFKELNVPVYPEKRIFKAIARSFCEKDIPADQLMFVAYKPPFSNGKYRTFTCGSD